jgi:hypothetical protein
MHYSAFFRIHERTGTALVSTSEEGTRIRLGARFEPEREVVAAPVGVLEHALAVSESAFRRQGSPGPLVARVVSAHSARVLGAPGFEVFVSAFSPAPEGPLHIEVDAHEGDVLGWFAPPLLRGSRDGAALGRVEAERRARAEASIPETATVTRADLEAVPAGRFWRFRFDVETPQEKGHVVVSLHARSGVAIGENRLLVATSVQGPRAGRERAHAVVAAALPTLLGADAELVSLIPGALVRGSRRLAGWIGTAKLADGSVARVSYGDDEVEVALDGEAKRTRVLVPAPRVTARGDIEVTV